MTVAAPAGLNDAPIARYDPASDDPRPGRRLRVFAALVFRSEDRICTASDPAPLLSTAPATIGYGELLARIESGDLAGFRGLFDSLPLRTGTPGPLLSAVPEGGAAGPRDPDLHSALQDLANEINEDIREAVESLDDAHAYYPGVDEGIEPVTDQHVDLVIWALQRELDRELRSGSGSISSMEQLPAVPLARLPWDVQRALVERRRWRFRQWGIGREQWQNDTWSLWAVPEDPGYVPRRVHRLAELTAGRKPCPRATPAERDG